MGEIEKYLLNLILKEKKIIAAGFMAGLLIFLTYYFFFYTALYTTTTKLYVKNILKPSIVAQYAEPGTIKSESGYSNPLFNLYELIKSEDIAFNVYERVKEQYPKDLGKLGVVSKESFYSAYLGLISSVVIPSTDVLTVNFKWTDRKNAKEVLAIVIDEFRKENLSIRRSLDTEKRIYLEEQTTEIEEKLEKLREEIKDYKIKNELSDANIEAANLIDVRMSLLREVSSLKAQIDYNTKKFIEYAKQLEINDPIVALKSAGVGNDPYLVKLSADLAMAQQNLAMLKTRFTDKYHEVVSLQGQIDELKRNIEERKVATVKNMVLPKTIYDGPATNIVSQFAQVHVEKLSQEVMLKALEKGIDDILKTENELHIKQIGLDNLKKQEEAFAMAYQNIKAKQLEAKIQENEIVDNLLTLMSPADASPFQLTLLTRFVGFLLFGTLSGLGIAYIKQGIEDKWTDIDELKKITGQDILGTIPWLKDENAENAGKIYNAAYANIASEIITKASYNNAYILSFISTSIGRNRSVITDNVAKFLANLEKTSIIIDFTQNFKQKPDITNTVNFIYNILKKEKFGFQRQLTAQELEIINNDVFMDEFWGKFGDSISKLLEEAIVVTDYEKDGKQSKLYYLGIDNTNVNIKYFVSTNAFSLLLKCLKRKFDFVLINAPHGNFMLPETNFIKKNSEAVAIIATMDSNREKLIKTINLVTESGQKILGIITREKDTELEKYFNKASEEEIA